MNMTKIKLLIILLISTNSFSQITKLKLDSEKKEIIKIDPYDSLENINFKNVKKHIGQTLYLKENSWSKKEGGYSIISLHTKPIFEISNNYIYKSVLRKNSTWLNTSDYEQLKGKLFYVNKILSNKNTEDSRDKDNCCLELIETLSKDTVYLYCDKFLNFDYFLTLGYFEKIKKIYIGKNYIYLNNRWEGFKKEDNEGGLYNINNGLERKDIPKGSMFKCIDLILKNEGDNEILAIMDNPIYGKSFSYFDVITSTGIFDYCYSKFETTEAHNKDIVRQQKLIKKYGKNIAKTILDGKVKIGFTKQMCIEAWGEPDNINRTSGSYGVHEQWVYDSGSYLYFEKGVLTTIQN